MARLTKKQKEAVAKIDKNKLYSVEEASSLVKEITNAKFDASIDIAVRLGVDPRKANQMVRGTVTLPHGVGKTVKVLALVTADKEAEAKEAGADYVGLDEYVEKIKGGWTDVDVIVTMPSVMGKVGALGRVLGPRGLMPNPKTGTVGPDLLKIVKEIAGGKFEFKTDKHGNVHSIFGKLSFGKEKLEANLNHFLATINEVKPTGSKGKYITNVTVCNAMGPGIRLNLVEDYFELYLPVYSNLGWEIGQPNFDQKIRFKFTLDPQSLLGLFRRRWY